MKATTTSRGPKLEDLTKAQLVRFVRERVPFHSDADLVRLQWEDAAEEWRRLQAVASQAAEEQARRAAAYTAASSAAKPAALAAYRDAVAASDQASDAADCAWRRSDALYTRMMHLSPGR